MCVGDVPAQLVDVSVCSYVRGADGREVVARVRVYVETYKGRGHACSSVQTATPHWQRQHHAPAPPQPGQVYKSTVFEHHSDRPC